jgi:hypothetical protein
MPWELLRKLRGDIDQALADRPRPANPADRHCDVYLKRIRGPITNAPAGAACSVAGTSQDRHPGIDADGRETQSSPESALLAID